MPVYRAYQEPGDFIVTFPRAYHGGFGNGYNVGEAVNFALRDWFPYGVDCQKRHRRLQRQNIVNLQELLMSEALEIQSKCVLWTSLSLACPFSSPQQHFVSVHIPFSLFILLCRMTVSLRTTASMGPLTLFSTAWSLVGALHLCVSEAQFMAHDVPELVIHSFSGTPIALDYAPSFVLLGCLTCIMCHREQRRSTSIHIVDASQTAGFFPLSSDARLLQHVVTQHPGMECKF